MIQKYTCIPQSAYDVIIVSNGSLDQIDSKLQNMMGKDLLENSQFTYLSTFNELIKRVEKEHFQGKVVFMFFDGLSYIQDTLIQLIDYTTKIEWMVALTGQQHQTTNTKTRTGTKKLVENAYLYFDSSISATTQYEPLDAYLNDRTVSFVVIVNIVHDILKKMSFMVGRIRNLYIDDAEDIICGERDYPLRCLVKNFPKVESIELLSRNVDFTPFTYF